MTADRRLAAERARARRTQAAARRYILGRATSPDDAQTLLQMLGLDVPGRAA